MREDFADWRGEARSIREGLAVLEADHLDVVRVRGRDGRDFLHRMSSAELKRIPPDRAVPAALLTPKARVICSMTVVPLAQETLCVLSRAHRDAVIEHLERFIIADDVELSFGDHELVGIYGAGLAQAGELSPLAQLEAYRVQELELLQTRCTVVGDDHLATPGVLAIVGTEQRSGLVDQVVAAGARRCGWRAYESCRVEAGTPLMGHELSQEVLILEAGQVVAVSFDKGCYPGQEPVCRIHNRGQVNRRLVGLRVAGDRRPELGEALQHPDKTDAGEVTSVAESVQLGQTIALGYVHRKFAAAGTTLALAGGGTATLAPLPQIPTEVWPLTCPRYNE